MLRLPARMSDAFVIILLVFFSSSWISIPRCEAAPVLEAQPNLTPTITSSFSTGKVPDGNPSSPSNNETRSDSTATAGSPASQRSFLDTVGLFGGGYGTLGDVIQPSDLSHTLAAATVPVNPIAAPFVPLAFQFTGASPSDYFNLKPVQDLVYPFLGHPLNTLLPAIDEEPRFRTADDPPVVKGPSKPVLTPQSVAAIVRAMALKGRSAADKGDTGVLTRLVDPSPLFPAPFIPKLDPIGIASFLDLLRFRPLSDFVYPFLDSEKNPWLTLLYYLTPTLRSAPPDSEDEGLTSNGTRNFDQDEGLPLSTPIFPSKEPLLGLEGIFGNEFQSSFLSRQRRQVSSIPGHFSDGDNKIEEDEEKAPPQPSTTTAEADEPEVPPEAAAGVVYRNSRPHLDNLLQFFVPDLERIELNDPGESETDDGEEFFPTETESSSKNRTARGIKMSIAESEELSSMSSHRRAVRQIGNSTAAAEQRSLNPINDIWRSFTQRFGLAGRSGSEPNRELSRHNESSSAGPSEQMHLVERGSSNSSTSVEDRQRGSNSTELSGARKRPILTALVQDFVLSPFNRVTSKIAHDLGLPSALTRNNRHNGSSTEGSHGQGSDDLALAMQKFHEGVMLLEKDHKSHSNSTGDLGSSSYSFTIVPGHSIPSEMKMKIDRVPEIIAG